MIIRRHHTANFTTIGNVLFDDVRLAADEVGILAYLLSRPDNWEVRRPALMRRWKVGRDAMKRVMRNLIKTGWCHAKKVRRTDNGTFYIIYEIRDWPGRELSDDEVIGALSLVSSEAADAESDSDSAADDMPETGDPPTPQPVAGLQGVVTRPWPIDNLTNTESINPESTKGVRAFSDMREAWPIEHVLSLVACETLHLRLGDPDKDAAFNGVRPYLDDCHAEHRKICDLATYYRERRWERFTAKAITSSLFTTKRGTPQAARWREYFSEFEPWKIRLFDEQMIRNGYYTTPSEWPPPRPQPKSKTDPPSDGLTDEDAREFINST